ncbi:substrate-binding domain-containing protein [Luteolibacter ambystomatis]
MHPVPRLSLVEQTALHLQQGIDSGRWKGAMPGVVRLAGDLGVSKDTAVAALALLEARGSIVSRGRGKRREVVGGTSRPIIRSLRVGLLLREELGKSVALTQEIFLRLMHDLEALGHKPVFAPKSQGDLGLDPARIGRMVRKCGADAWVISGAPVEVLDWFNQQGPPFIVLGGRHGGYPLAMASVSSLNAIRESVDRLIGLGHRRIVLVCLPDWVRPVPGRMMNWFFEHLRAAGLPASEYNAPYHETTPEGFERLLESLFQLTSPTALIVPNMHYAFATISFLAARGLSVPRDVSLVVRSSDPVFDWGRLRIAYFHCPADPLIRRVLRWVEACSKGAPDFEEMSVDAVLVPGDSIAPPPGAVG